MLTEPLCRPPKDSDANVASPMAAVVGGVLSCQHCRTDRACSAAETLILRGLVEEKVIDVASHGSAARNGRMAVILASIITPSKRSLNRNLLSDESFGEILCRPCAVGSRGVGLSAKHHRYMYTAGAESTPLDKYILRA